MGAQSVGMEDDFVRRPRGVPGSRASAFLASLQPRTTKPSVCRACNQYFEEGETRVCTRGARQNGRFLHVDCILGGVRAGMTFAADSAREENTARILADRVRHVTAVGDAGQSGVDVGAVVVDDGLFPPTLESPLPSSAWFQQLQWGDLRKVQGDTFVQIPHRLEDAFCEALGVALREIVNDSDAERVATGWKAFLLLFWLLLFKPPDTQDGESCATLLTERLDRFWQGDVSSIFREHCNAVKRGKKSQRAVEQDSLLVKKVKTLSRAGESGRALRALDGSSRVPITPQIARELADLFGVGGQPPMIDDSDLVQTIDPQELSDTLLKDLQRLPRLSAPGPLQTRNEHLMLLAGSSASAEPLAKALASLATGAAPSEVIVFLRGGLLTPLEKDDGGHRPLTLSNVARRAGLKALLRHQKDTVRQAVGSLQYAISRKSGVDALHKSLQTRLATHSGRAVVSLDFRAAFQKLNRVKACEAVAKHAVPLQKSCQAWYGGRATHVVRVEDGTLHEVETDEGVDQGCPLGAFIFAVTTRDPAEKVLDFARALDAYAAFYMYLDDCYIVALPDVMERIVQYVQVVFSEIGLELNVQKTQAWCLRQTDLPQSLQPHYREDFKVLKRALRVPGDADHQGIPIVSPQSTLQNEIVRLQRLTQALAKAVKNGLDLHTSLSLLRVYAGPASQYTLRTCQVSSAAAAEYDAALAKAWSDLLGREISTEEPRLWLPLRMGGCGAASARARMYTAPWASWIAVRDELVQHMAARDIDEVLEQAPLIEQQVRDLHASLVAQGTLPSIQYASPVRALTYNTTQKTMVAFIHKKTLRTLRANMDDDDAAFLRSASSQAVGAFLETPLDDRWVMTNSRFTTACLRRLGAEYPGYPVPPIDAQTCTNKTRDGRVCGAVCDARGKHQECCAPGGGLMTRHDSLVRCLGILSARNLDPKPKLEQIIPELARPVMGQIEQARLDVVVHDGVSRTLVDVVVCSALAGDASFRRACARRDGHAARRAEVAKRARYPSEELVPFAVETGGRLGADARAFLVRCADASDDPARELQYLYRAVSSVLQDGVARQLAPRTL